MEEVLELEYYFATIVVKIDSSRRHQSMLNLGRKLDEKQDISIVLKMDIIASICNILRRTQHQSCSIQAGNI